MRLTGVTALVAVLCLASPAGVEAREIPAQAGETTVTARQLALSRRYIDLIQGEQLRTAIQAMVEVQVQTEGRNLPDEDRRFLTGLTGELVGDLVPAMMDQMVPVYANGFSESELEALLAFYDTPEGRTIIAKTFELLPVATAAVMSVMPRMFDKMAVRMCEHYGCDPVEVRAAMYAGAGLPSPAGTPAPARRK
ncbi:DUF2059 domain-containing protein [uncultured Brevundimonas sp.]|uniref:DUF2059 domain-containing protein n=1 Tax=uncultured Brevundimonas sp. TaxID=213418 RepID=UPI0030EC2B00|tara:strand:+ start:6448 stop:7029 length:582 start_codon:yes stop_codon:yes gene_type:complete